MRLGSRGGGSIIGLSKDLVLYGWCICALACLNLLLLTIGGRSGETTIASYQRVSITLLDESSGGSSASDLEMPDSAVGLRLPRAWPVCGEDAEGEKWQMAGNLANVSSSSVTTAPLRIALLSTYPNTPCGETVSYSLHVYQSCLASCLWWSAHPPFSNSKVHPFFCFTSSSPHLGLATFSQSLRDALSLTGESAVVDIFAVRSFAPAGKRDRHGVVEPTQIVYGPEVVFVIDKSLKASYLQAAEVRVLSGHSV